MWGRLKKARLVKEGNERQGQKEVGVGQHRETPCKGEATRKRVLEVSKNHLTSHRRGRWNSTLKACYLLITRCTCWALSHGALLSQQPDEAESKSSVYQQGDRGCPSRQFPYHTPNKQTSQMGDLEWLRPGPYSDALN